MVITMKENEQELAYQIWKTYKTTNEYPKNISKIQAFNLLCKYNYITAKSLDKPMINHLTEICNKLDTEKIIIAYGDFTLQTLYFGLKNFKITKYANISVQYIDCLVKKPSDELRYAITTKSLFNQYIIYVIDNLESLDKKEVSFLTKILQDLYNSNKAIIGCCMSVENIHQDLLKFKKIKLGECETTQYPLQKAILSLFNEKEQRNKVFEPLSAIEDGQLHYLLAMMVYNIPSFYQNQTTIQHNFEVCRITESLLYKIDTDKLVTYLVYGIIPTLTKRVVQFPISMKKKNGELKK